MTNFVNDGLCNETSGFLFSHRCDRMAMKQCLRCGKPICHDHGHFVDDGVACTSCMKHEIQPRAGAADPNAVDPNAAGATGAAAASQVATPGTPVRDTRTSYGSSYYDDPYFYGSYYYPGYGRRHGTYFHSTHSTHSDASSSGATAGDAFASSPSQHDPDDFTDGDAAGLRNEGDDAFESEMGES